MRGDRVRIGATGTMSETPGSMTFVYMPKIDPNTKQFLQAGDGTVLVESLGGVKNGSTGTIQGNPIFVHKTQMKDYQGTPGLGSNDTIAFYPVFLDHYQQLGWFPVDVIKILSGPMS